MDDTFRVGFSQKTLVTSVGLFTRRHSACSLFFFSLRFSCSLAKHRVLKAKPAAGSVRYGRGFVLRQLSKVHFCQLLIRCELGGLTAGLV